MYNHAAHSRSGVRLRVPRAISSASELTGLEAANEACQARAGADTQPGSRSAEYSCTGTAVQL